MRTAIENVLRYDSRRPCVKWKEDDVNKLAGGIRSPERLGQHDGHLRR
jgi:hypothetical protein